MIPAGATREGSLCWVPILTSTGRIWSSLLTLFPGKATAMPDFPWPDGKRCAVALTFDMDGETAAVFLHPPNACGPPVVDLGRDLRRARRHAAYPGRAQQPPDEEHLLPPRLDALRETFGAEPLLGRMGESNPFTANSPRRWPRPRGRRLRAARRRQPRTQRALPAGAVPRRHGGAAARIRGLRAEDGLRLLAGWHGQFGQIGGKIGGKSWPNW